jgi:hypothetical protein
MGQKTVYRRGGKFINHGRLRLPEGRLHRQLKHRETVFGKNEFAITDPNHGSLEGILSLTKMSTKTKSGDG